MHSVTAKQLINMLLSGTRALEDRQKEINDLNVFPVPDGDTGTNMVLTAHGMVRALTALNLKEKGLTVGQVAATAAEAALLGARGNSGVIFSQFIRGLARGLKRRFKATPTDMARAFQFGLVYAYQAVTHPVEGTILTVAREAARSARPMIFKKQELHNLLALAIEGGNQALARTPEQLPVLKQAGVVDAGGYGLLVFLRGGLQGLTGDEVALPRLEIGAIPTGTASFALPSDLAFIYCTELIVKGREFDISKINETRLKLEPLGDSLILVPGKGVLKVHIHTNHPGQILEIFTDLGTLHDVKVDNMAEQHKDSLWADTPETLVVAVAPGDGLADLFRSLGADQVIPGGETMNPSVQDFMNAMRGAGEVLILPNSNNIRLAAEQAAEITSQQVWVAPTSDPQQGLVALIALNRKDSMEKNLERMLTALSSVKSARITFAARDSVWNDEAISAGTILGFTDGQLLAQGKDLSGVTRQLVSRLLAETQEAELVTLFKGLKVSDAEGEQVLKALAETFPQLEIELKDGGQPNDYFLLMLE